MVQDHEAYFPQIRFFSLHLTLFQLTSSEQTVE